MRTVNEKAREARKVEIMEKCFAWSRSLLDIKFLLYKFW